MVRKQTAECTGTNAPPEHELEPKSNDKKRDYGVGEWADYSENICYGCSNNCTYCYAKKNEKHWDYKDTPWYYMEPNLRTLAKGYRKRDGVSMFPTSHDITTDLMRLDSSEIQKLYDDRKIPKRGYKTLMNMAQDRFVWSVLDLSIFQLKKLLKPGNQVLITTKPRMLCINTIMTKLAKDKDQITFRFTITSHYEHVITKWETKAPPFFERMGCLMNAYDRGWNTSVSIEPFLDPDPIPLIKNVAPYVGHEGTIWLGKLNYRALSFNTKRNVTRIVKKIRDLDPDVKRKIRLKDSIQRTLNLHSPYVTDRNLKTL
jgi:hypothetical protein